jgi:hypothetical protein
VVVENEFYGIVRKYVRTRLISLLQKWIRNADRFEGFWQWCISIRITRVLDFVHRPIF